MPTGTSESLLESSSYKPINFAQLSLWWSNADAADTCSSAGSLSHWSWNIGEGQQHCSHCKCLSASRNLDRHPKSLGWCHGTYGQNFGHHCIRSCRLLVTMELPPLPRPAALWPVLVRSSTCLLCCTWMWWWRPLARQGGKGPSIAQCAMALTPCSFLFFPASIRQDKTKCIRTSREHYTALVLATCCWKRHPSSSLSSERGFKIIVSPHTIVIIYILIPQRA